MATQTKNKRPTPTQVRAARRARRQRRRRFIRWGGFSVLGIVAFAFIIGLFVPSIAGVGGGGGGGGLFGNSTPDGPGQRISDAGRSHVSPGEIHGDYTSVPATSGPHFGQPAGPTRWGIHDEQIPDEVLIHNLEHGGIGVFYDCPDGCDEIVQQLSGIVNRGVQGGFKIIMSPYEGMNNTIALVAWTFLDEFDVYDEQRVQDFMESHESSGNAPEPTAR